MDRDDIIRMAREAGATVSSFHGRFVMYRDDIERFAELVAAAEREACAKVCEEHIGEDLYDMFGKHLAKQCAEAIRERSEQ